MTESKYHIFDIPPTAVTSVTVEDMAAYLIRRKRWAIWIATALLTLGGLVSAYVWSNPMLLARSGALITALGVINGAWQLRYLKMFVDIEQILFEAFTEVEFDKVGRDPIRLLDAKALANKRIKRSVPALAEAVQRQLIALNLIVAGVGTLIWGFGDLLPF